MTDDVSFDQVFAEAEMAAAAAGGGSAGNVVRRTMNELVVDDALARRITTQLREQRLLVTSDARTTFRETGDCVAACRATIEHYDVRLFKVPRVDESTPETHWIDAGGGWRLHACTEATCALTAAALHAIDVSDDWRRAGGLLTREPSSGGGAHWCPRHTRMHACASTCTQTMTNDLGFDVCVLSGRTVSSSARQQFGEGTTIMTAEGFHQRQQAQWERREETAMQRSAMAAVEMVVRVGNTQVDQKSPGNRSLSGAQARRDDAKRRRLFATGGGGETTSADDIDDDDGVYVDVDVPSDDLFGNTLDENTFGDGVASWLVRSYTQAYATVHLMLFSKERARVEANIRRAVVQEATARLNTYLAAESKPGRFVSVPIMRQLEMRALNSKKVLPVLLVPENAVGRLTAYYAMVITEFYAQLVTTITDIKGQLTGAATAAAERFLTMSSHLATLAPNVLDLMHEGLAIESETIIGAETLLSIYPEMQTMNLIGIDTKRCTDSMKMLKQLVVAIAESGTPLARVTTTRVPTFFVLFERGSVVSEFLRQRRRRLMNIDDVVAKDAYRL